MSSLTGAGAECLPARIKSLSKTSSKTDSQVKTKHSYRPFVIPRHDPEHSNQDPPQQLFGLQPLYPYPTEDHFASKEALHFAWYDGQRSLRRSSYDLSIGPAQNQLHRCPSFQSTTSTLASHGFLVATSQLSRSKYEFGSTTCIELIDTDSIDGKLAWLHVLVGLLVVFNAQGLNMSFGIFQAYYEKVLLPGTSSSTIAWIGSVQVFFLFAMSLIVSPAVNKGFFRLCFHGGSLLLLIAFFITSYCTLWWQLFLVQGVITGLAMGSVFSSGLMVLLAYFPTKLSLATGIAAAGAPLGGIFFPLVARSAVPHVGFAWTVRIFALVNLVTMIAANVIIKPRTRGFRHRKMDSQTKSRRSPAQGTPRRSDYAFTMMAAGMFFTFFGFYITYYFIVLFAEDVLHLTADKSVDLLIAMNAANLAGRILPSVVSDSCIGPLNTITPWTIVTSMLAFSWIAATNSRGLFLIACFYGFTSSAIQSLYTSTVVGFAGPRGSNEAARRIGVVLAVIGVAVLFGAPTGGALITRNKGDYLQTQLLAGASLFLGGLFFLAARISRSGRSSECI